MCADKLDFISGFILAMSWRRAALLTVQAVTFNCEQGDIEREVGVFGTLCIDHLYNNFSTKTKTNIYISFVESLFHTVTQKALWPWREGKI